MEYDTVSKEVLTAARYLRETKPAYWVSSDLPWRVRRTPYRVFLAEFLLVRTRTDLVAAQFERIVSKYPTVQHLSEAGEKEIEEVLYPLGLLKRARYLLKAARYLAEKHRGEIPSRFQELIRIPGMGLYTSAAVMAFAFQAPDVPADVNILRFLSRITGLPMGHPTKGSIELHRLLPALSQVEGGPDPETLLDFTRTICRTRKPRCFECPVSSQCIYFREQGGI